jgi:hypothetical protein
MLLALLKNVENWVYDLLFNNDLADKEAKLYFKDKNESN